MKAQMSKKVGKKGGKYNPFVTVKGKGKVKPAEIALTKKAKRANPFEGVA